MKKWKLEDAKNGFSEVVRRAVDGEPQLVTRHGREAVVVVSAAEYQRLTTQQDFVEFMRDSPLAQLLAEGEIDLDRPRDLGRDIDL